jgi:hypothetical protein
MSQTLTANASDEEPTAAQMAVGAVEMCQTFDSIVRHLTALTQGQPSPHSNEEVLEWAEDLAGDLATVQSWFETQAEATTA